MPKDKKNKTEELAEVDTSETSENYEYSVKIMRWLLQSLGMWPITSPTYPTFLTLFLTVTALFLLILFMVTIGLQTFLIVKDFKERVRNVGPFTFSVMNAIKFTTLLIRKNDFRDCLDCLSRDWRMTRRRIDNDLMLASAKKGITFTTMCASFMLTGGISYTTFFSFIQERTVINNVSRKVLAYPAYFVFFDPYDHFYKVYAIHTFCGYVAFTTTAAIASIAIVFTMHVCGQISVISRMLRDLANGNFDKEIFQQIIEKHLRALRLAKRLEDLLSGICSVEMLGCCFCICLTGYYAVTEFKVDNLGPYTYCLLMISFTFNIFTFCYVGELLSEKCNNIRNVVYNVDWYLLSPEDTRSLLMIMLSTQRPVVLTAGKMATLSMRSFSYVMKYSLSYLNMLMTVANH